MTVRKLRLRPTESGSRLPAAVGVIRRAVNTDYDRAGLDRLYDDLSTLTAVLAAAADLTHRLRTAAAHLPGVIGGLRVDPALDDIHQPEELRQLIIGRLGDVLLDLPHLINQLRTADHELGALFIDPVIPPSSRLGIPEPRRAH